MASVPNVVSMSVEEYLRTAFEPDAEYVEGAIEERNLGEWDHGKLQSILLLMFSSHELDWEIDVAVETRVQVAPRRFRVPDVCVVDARLPVEQIVRTAPLLCVEVVSPEDRLPRLLERVKDFHAMGVAVVWVFDPATRRVWISRAEDVKEWTGGTLQVEGTKIALDPALAFAKLDRRR